MTVPVVPHLTQPLRPQERRGEVGGNRLDLSSNRLTWSASRSRRLTSASNAAAKAASEASPPGHLNSCLTSLTLGKHRIVVTPTTTHEGTMTSTTGGCLCGRVRYSITAAPIRSGICHCRNCRRYTGSAFEPFMMFHAASVNLQGELRT